MAVNKVIYGGKTLVDLSSDTVTAKDVRKGAIFHAPSGETATGTLGTATQSEDGMMSAADKKKLDGIAAGANKNTVTGVKGSAETSYRTGNVNLTAANVGAVPTTGGTMTGQLVMKGTAESKPIVTRGIAGSDGNGNLSDLYLQYGNETNDTVHFGKTGGGSISNNGTSYDGTAAHAPWSGVTGKPSYYDPKAIKTITRSGTTFTYTCMDGTTGTFTQQDNNTTYNAATQAAAGLMSAADKKKLDGIAAGAQAVPKHTYNASDHSLTFGV